MKRSRHGCATCKARKVKCDESPGACRKCQQRGLSCPGYTSLSEAEGDSETFLQLVYNRSGVSRRTNGACDECRKAKARCDQALPTCQRCQNKQLRCNANTKSYSRKSLSQYSGDHTENLQGSGSPVDTVECQTAIQTEAWLFGESIPSERSQLRDLVHKYFEHVHSIRCYNFIHRPTFMKALDDGDLVQVYGGALVNIICAHGARFFAAKCTWSDSFPGAAWALKAQSLLLSRFKPLSIQDLMAFVLLWEYSVYYFNSSAAIMISALCTRAALLLRLDLNMRNSVPENRTAESNTRVEVRRRVFWACWNIENTVGPGVERLATLSRAIPSVPLPCSEDDFLYQNPSLQPTLLSTLDVEIPCIEPPASGLVSAYIQIMAIRNMILRYIRVHEPRPLPWQVGSRFFALTQLLESWRDVLPSSMVLSEHNIYIHHDQQQLGLYFAINIFYHFCYCDLFRVMMPGYDFPLRRCLTNAPLDFITYCQNRCIHHAEALSEVLRFGQRHTKSAFDDRIYQAACYESCRLQLAGRRLQNINHVDAQKTCENLIANLDILLSQAKIRPEKLISLVRDIQSSGLTDAIAFCQQHLQTSGESTPSVAGDSRLRSADDVDYLHPLNPFRAACDEVAQADRSENADNSTLRSNAWEEHAEEGLGSNAIPIMAASPFGGEVFERAGSSFLLDDDNDADNLFFWDPLAPWVFDAFRLNEEAHGDYIDEMSSAHPSGSP